MLNDKASSGKLFKSVDGIGPGENRKAVKSAKMLSPANSFDLYFIKLSIRSN
ncbi:MAG: hypothetical protein ACXWT0_07175 [Methylobacter sp.]